MNKKIVVVRAASSSRHMFLCGSASPLGRGNVDRVVSSAAFVIFLFDWNCSCHQMTVLLSCYCTYCTTVHSGVYIAWWDQTAICNMCKTVMFGTGSTCFLRSIRQYADGGRKTFDYAKSLKFFDRASVGSIASRPPQSWIMGTVA